MIRTLLVSFFMTLYILLVGPPLLAYTLITRNPDPLFRAGIGGVMFFVRAAGVRVRVVGTGRIPAAACLFAANHYPVNKLGNDARIINRIRRDQALWCSFTTHIQFKKLSPPLLLQFAWRRSGNEPAYDRPHP